MEPDSPTKAAVGVQSRAERKSTLEARWKKAPCTAENYQTGGHISGNKVTVDENNDASSSALRGDGDVLWQSALSRFAQETSPTSEESGSNVHHARDYPPTLSREQPQDQEDYRNFTGFNRGMNDVGVLEIDTFEGESIVVDESSGLTATDDSTAQTEQSMGKLSLWQTCKVLYQRNPMIKFYFAGLLILLIASVAIVGVVISQNSKSSNKDCATASYKDAQILLPDESQPVRARGFGTSIAASSEFLIVGAPDSECNSQEASCEPFTAGGGAYVYSRNSNNQWELHSSFIFDDGVSSGDKYGKSVAIASDSTTVVVGSPENDSFGVVAGAIYVIEQPFGSTPAIRLVSDDLGVNDLFGGSVGVAATTIGSNPPVHVTNVVTGASYDDEFGFSSGTVYVFSKYNGKPPASACGGNVEVGTWVQCQKLLPDDGQPHDQFGKSVDVSGNTIVVGSMWDDAKGIDSGEQRSGGKCNPKHIRHCLTNTFHDASSNH